MENWISSAVRKLKQKFPTISASNLDRILLEFLDTFKNMKADHIKKVACLTVCVCVYTSGKKLPTTAQQKDKFQLLFHPIQKNRLKKERNQIDERGSSIVYRATVS